MTRKYRSYVHDTVHAMDELLKTHHEDNESVNDVLDEVNEVYEESELFRQVVGIMNNEFKTREQQYAQIYAITKRFQDNLFTSL